MRCALALSMQTGEVGSACSFAACALTEADILWCSAGGFRPQFLPSLSGVMLLFSRMVTAASLWVHILAINLYAARTAYMQGTQGPAFLPCCLGTSQCMYFRDPALYRTEATRHLHYSRPALMARNNHMAHSGLERGVPVRHTVLLCALLGPVGLLSHFATCALCAPLHASEPVAAPPGLVPAPETA